MKTLEEASNIMVQSRGDSSKLDSMAMPFSQWIELVDFSKWNALNGN
jgi:hypothetical protein